MEGVSFNRSNVSYVRVAAVDDPDDPGLLNANAGRTQQSKIGQVVILDGSGSKGPAESITYTWVQENPVGSYELEEMAPGLGTQNCSGTCYKANFDADSDVDGADLAILANNWGSVSLTDTAITQFSAGIARPHIFRLTVSDGVNTDNETTMVAVSHPNVDSVLTPPDVESICQ